MNIESGKITAAASADAPSRDEAEAALDTLRRLAASDPNTASELGVSVGPALNRSYPADFVPDQSYKSTMPDLQPIATRRVCSPAGTTFSVTPCTLSVAPGSPSSRPSKGVKDDSTSWPSSLSQAMIESTVGDSGSLQANWIWPLMLR